MLFFPSIAITLGDYDYDILLVSFVVYEYVYAANLLLNVSIFIVSGILAVLAQSTDSDHKAKYTVSIAILASVSIFWQSLMKQLDYGGRASLHDSAANSLTKILKLATLRSREQQINDLDDTLDDRKKKKAAELPDGLDHVDGSVPTSADAMSQKDNDTGSAASHQDQEVHVVDGEDHFVLSKQFEQGGSYIMQMIWILSSLLTLLF